MEASSVSTIGNITAIQPMHDLRSEWTGKPLRSVSRSAIPNAEDGAQSLKAQLKGFGGSILKFITRSGSASSKEAKTAQISEHLVGLRGPALDLSCFEGSDSEKNGVRNLIHFGGKSEEKKATDKSPTKENSGTTRRAKIRAALLLALHHGGSIAQASELETALSLADDATRDGVLRQLQRGETNVSFTYPKDGTAESFQKDLAPLTPDEIARGKGQMSENDDETDTIVAQEPSFYQAEAFLSSNQYLLSSPEVLRQDKPDEVAPFAMVSAYTRPDGFGMVNRELRAAATDPEHVPNPDLQAYARGIRKGLEKLPDHNGWVMRGTGTQDHSIDKFSHYQKGAVVSENGFTSTSIDKQWYGKKVQFLIHSRHGKEITGLPQDENADGREVLFPPDTEFKILDRFEKGGKTSIVMDELE